MGLLLGILFTGPQPYNCKTYWAVELGGEGRECMWVRSWSISVVELGGEGRECRWVRSWSTSVVELGGEGREDCRWV